MAWTSSISRVSNSIPATISIKQEPESDSEIPDSDFEATGEVHCSSYVTDLMEEEETLNRDNVDTGLGTVVMTTSEETPPQGDGIDDILQVQTQEREPIGANLQMRVRINQNPSRIPVPRTPPRIGGKTKIVEPLTRQQKLASRPYRRMTLGKPSTSFSRYNFASVSAYIIFTIISACVLMYLGNSFFSTGETPEKFPTIPHAPEPVSMLQFPPAPIIIREQNPSPTGAGAVVTNCPNLTSNYSDQEEVTKMLQYQLRDSDRRWRLKTGEYLEKIGILEEEIFNLQEQFKERLAKKEDTLRKLKQAITNFKQEHLFISFSTIHQFLAAIVAVLWGTFVYACFNRVEYDDDLVLQEES